MDQQNSQKTECVQTRKNKIEPATVIRQSHRQNLLAERSVKRKTIGTKWIVPIRTRLYITTPDLSRVCAICDPGPGSRITQTQSSPGYAVSETRAFSR
jgi:hypothetical protein